jgi:hypothetical protein
MAHVQNRCASFPSMASGSCHPEEPFDGACPELCRTSAILDELSDNRVGNLLRFPVSGGELKREQC